MSVATLSPVIPLSVSGPTKCDADFVITGTTRAPALMQRRATSTLLYAAMLPVTASATVRPSRGLLMRAPSWTATVAGGKDSAAAAERLGADNYRPRGFSRRFVA